MLHKRLKRNQKYAVLVLLVIIAHPSVAVDRSVRPFLYVKEQYNSNLLLQPGSQPEIWNTSAGAGMRLKAVEEVWGVLGDIRLESRRYHGQDQLDTDNQFFKGSSFYKTERMRWDLSSSYFRDSSIVTEELEELDITGVANRRQRIRVTPAWTYRLTETTDLGLLYTYRDVFHDNALESGRINYKTHEARSFLTHRLTETSGITPAFSYLTYEETEFPFSANLYNATLTFFTAFSETLKGSLGLGGRYLSASGPGTAVLEGNDTDLLVNALLTKRFEHTRLSASYIRDIYVTGTSGLSERNRVSVRLRRDFSATLDGLLELIFLNQETVFSSVAARESDSYRAHARLRWHMTDEFNVALAYRYTLRDRALGAADADSHAAFVTMEYNFGEINF